MTSICYDCFVLACILASLPLPAICTDEVVSTELHTTASDLVSTTANSVAATTTTADWVTTTTADFVTTSTADFITSTSTTSTNFVVATTTTTADWVTTATTADWVTATTTTADWVTTTTISHGEVEGNRGGQSPNFEQESLEDMDCTKICSQYRSDESDYGEKERWNKSNRTWNGTFEHEAVEDQWHRRNGSWNGTFEPEGFKGEWEGSHNGTFQHEAVEDQWRGHSGTWNGTFEPEGFKGEWEGSHNSTLNKSFDRESGEGNWHRNSNGPWISHYADAEGEHHENNGTHRSNQHRVAHGTREGNAKCDCRQRSGVENERDVAGHAETGRHGGGSDTRRGGKSEADGMVHSGSDHDDGGDGFRSAALKDEQPPQTEVSASSNNDQDNGGKGFGNAAVLGLAGATIAALCVASSVLLICYRRSGKVPLTSGAVLSGKSVDNAASSDSGAVAGVVVNNV